MWRSIIRFKTKQKDEWLTTTFGPRREYSEYYVEVSGEYLEDKGGLPSTSRGAAIFALKHIKKRFEETRDENGDRSIEKIAENKVACWKGRCIRNAYVPIK